jgi:formate-dependent nitrite reductase membrane component NrfD
MSSTFYTAAPEWRWLIILYFFIGGLAGGCYFLAVLMDLFGRPADRRLARLGYLVAFPAVVVCGLLLTLDLTRPERFWHMLLQSGSWRPMLKVYSPMSVGAWGLLLFGGFSLLSFLGALGDERGRFPALRPPAPLGVLIGVIGGVFGAFLAGYTGVLLSVTNRPIWADTNLLGLVFLISAASTSAALLVLLGAGSGAAGAMRALSRFDSWVLALELVALIGLVVSLGSVARLWLSAWGGLLVVGVVLAGILAPLALHWRERGAHARSPVLASVLVLVGGFLLRVVVVLSSEGV